MGAGGVTANRLRLQLVENYDGLVRRLTRRLGSSEFAREALHETFVKLDRVGETTEIRSPADYIFRTAINVANDQRRASSARVSAGEIDALLDIADDRPDPAAEAEARSDVKALMAAMERLPSRPRDVFYRIAVAGCSSKEIAESLGVTTRTVESDFRLALLHCADHLGQVLPKRSGGPRRRL